jgi:hypothetical protein
MNEHNFKKWFLVLIGFVVMVLGFIYFSVTPRNAATLKALNTQANSIPEPIVADTSAVRLEDNPEVFKLSDDELAAIIDELQPHQYHPDPFIEARIVSGMYEICSAQSNIEAIVHSKLTENNQVAAATDFLDYCSEAKSRYPLLLNSTDRYSTVNSIPANTELGMLNKQNLSEYYLTNPTLFQNTEKKKLSAIMVEENSVLLYESSLVPFVFIGYGEVLPISSWLGSLETDYNNSVYRYALSKMACRYQPTDICEAYGVVSLMFCFEDQALCGLDFETIFATSVMPGMQQDVELLISHLEQLDD